MFLEEYSVSLFLLHSFPAQYIFFHHCHAIPTRAKKGVCVSFILDKSSIQLTMSQYMNCQHFFDIALIVKEVIFDLYHPPYGKEVYLCVTLVYFFKTKNILCTYQR